MSPDDLTYVAILIGSVVFSALLRLVPRHSRATASAAVGAVAIAGACGEAAIHPASGLLLAIANHVFMPPGMRRGGAFVLAFSHLGVLRALGVATGPTNAALLVLVLRFAAAGDAEDGPRSAAELVRYTCCYHGLFTAPFYTYAEWAAAMRAPQPLPMARDLARAVLAVLVALVVWQGVAKQFPFSHALDVEAWEGWHSHRALYFYASSFQYRFRFYACWLVMRVSAMLLGFAQTSNVDLGATELCTSPSEYIAGWNTSVQSWLKAFVYRPLPRSTPRSVRQLVVFGVSAFWHGIHPGYYLCFAGMFVMVNVEALVRASLLPLVPPWAMRGLLGRLVGLGCHLWTMWCFCYTGIAFNLKDWGQIFDAWAKFGNYGVWLTALPAAAALAVALVKLLVSGRVLSGGVPPPSVAAAAAAPDPPPAPAASAASTAADGKGRGHKSPARASSRAVPSAKKSASKPARGAAASATAAAAGPSGVASFDDDEQDEAAEAVPLQLKPSPRRKAKPRTPAESPRRLETRRSKSPHVLRMTP